MDLKNLFVSRELPRDRTELSKRLASEAGATISEMVEYILNVVEKGGVIEEAVRDRLAPIIRVAGGLPENLLERHKAMGAYALKEENIEALEALMVLRPDLMEDMTARMRVLCSGPWTRVMLRMSAQEDEIFPRMSICMLYHATPPATRKTLAAFLVDQALHRPDLVPGLRAVVDHARITGVALGDDIVEAYSKRDFDFQTVHEPLLDKEGNEVGH